MKHETPPRHNRHWTPEEDRILEWGWAQVDIAKLAKRLGRTETALANRATHKGLPNAVRGHHSLRAVADILGYDIDVIALFAKRNGLPLRRQSLTLPNRPVYSLKFRRYAITDDQMAALHDALESLGWPVFPNKTENHSGKWGQGKKPTVCRRCGTANRPHLTRGLCTCCRRRCERDGTLHDYAPIWRKVAVSL